MLSSFSSNAGGSDEKRLKQWFRAMNAQDQATLLRFAEYLVSHPHNNLPAIQVFPEPELIPRPEQESVVKAIKRLVASYPMIERDRLLNETSQLMSAHVIHGKSANIIIDELEILFKTHYEQLKQAFEAKKTQNSE
jgi:uncharacterized protein YccT (UPF0319 family)